MLSNNSTSKHLAIRGRVSGVWILCLIALVAPGCGKKDAAAPKPPRLAYVRLNELVASHPFAAEIERLARLEEALTERANKPTKEQTIPGASVGYTLPALPQPIQVSQASLQALRKRNQEQIERLQRIAELEIAVFTKEYRDRQKKLVEQRRQEEIGRLLAPDSELAVLEDRERERIFQETVNTLRNEPSGLESLLSANWSLIENKVGIRANRAVVNEQLKPDAVVPLTVLSEPAGTSCAKRPGELREPVFDDETIRQIVEREIARLEANQDTTGISRRARLEWKDRKEEERLAIVNAAIQRVKEAAEARLLALSQEIAARREARLAAIQQDEATITRDERALRDALFDVVQNKQQATLAVAQSPTGGNSTRPLRIDTLFAVAPPQPGEFSNRNREVSTNATQEIAQQLAQQKAALTRAVEAAVRSAVQDTAQARNIDVVIVESADVPAQWQNRENLTGLFKTWIRPGGR